MSQFDPKDQVVTVCVEESEVTALRHVASAAHRLASMLQPAIAAGPALGFSAARGDSSMISLTPGSSDGSLVIALIDLADRRLKALL